MIGGGQAGLAMSAELRQRGREHLVLERGRIAERWRSERWDSLHFQFPNWMLRLPGWAYAGSDPDGFMHRDDVVAFIASYAAAIAAPVWRGFDVTALDLAEEGRFRVQAGGLTFVARHVVVATGPYQSARVPKAAAGIAAGITQVTANRYTRPSELPPGDVLVVGSGGSGCQIVEDLLLHGRQVHFSLRRHRRVPRRYRGQDFGQWDEEMGLTNRERDQIPPGFRAPLLTGVDGGHTVDLRSMADRGVRLLGSLRGIGDDRAHFNTDLNANLAAGDAAYQDMIRAIDAYIEARGDNASTPGELDMAAATLALTEFASLGLWRNGIRTVVWALGYDYAFDWIHCPVLDANGAPLHQRGVTAVPGLYFLGLPRQHKVKSAFLWGVGEDAAYIADRILERD